MPSRHALHPRDWRARRDEVDLAKDSFKWPASGDAGKQVSLFEGDYVANSSPNANDIGDAQSLGVANRRAETGTAELATRGNGYLEDASQ